MVVFEKARQEHVKTRTSLKQGRMGLWWKTKHTTHRIMSCGEFLFQHVYYTHLLSKIKQTPLSHWALPLPLRVMHTIISMPGFLFDQATITTGHLEHARIVAQDIGRQPWEYTNTQTREVRTCQFDPMLSIGPWVITGWSDDEHLVPTFSQRMSARFAGPQTIDSFCQRYDRQAAELLKKQKSESVSTFHNSPEAIPR